MVNSGIVYLVGAGPGDPDLLTVRAHRLLQSADIVLYDHLVSDEVMDLIPESAECISVPRSTGKYCAPQSEINNLLVELANKGKLVVRLKCGDPYLFGRGSEEARFLLKNGIRFKAVPGVSTATGFSVYSGIPLTHRGLSNSVRVITGYQTDNQEL
ncbi:MAG: uroporphyrinogen-III C-methyltransferase, partial [Gammaproteobacteria bacterium]